jgi:putative membrane protein
MDAAQGGMAEVSLGQMATQRATSNAVKQYGQRMVREHTQANKELMQLASQKGVTPPKDMGPKYKAAMDRLSQLPKASFDQAYMSEAGINGHLESQAVYQRQAQLGQDPDLKAFAAKILPTVVNHLQMARDMKSNTAAKNQSNTTVKN